VPTLGRLRLDGLCTPDLAARVWQVSNPNSVEVIFRWQVYGSIIGQGGTQVVPAASGAGPGTITFRTLVEPDTDTVVIYVDGVLQDNKAGNASLCAPVPPTTTPAPPTATLVPPTATNVPPTATLVPPTTTNVPPTATAVPPSDTQTPPAGTTTPEASKSPTPGATMPVSQGSVTPTKTPESVATVPALWTQPATDAAALHSKWHMEEV
jgi:hypothetical protein